MTRTKHMAQRSGKRRRPSEATAPEAAGTSLTPTRRSARNAPSSSTEVPKQRKRRRAQGTVALQEIRRLQKTYKLLIPAAPFIRTVKELSNFFSPQITRWTAEALVAIQEAAEDYIIELFQEAMLCAIHAKRVTLNITYMFQLMELSLLELMDNLLVKKDFELARRIGGIGQPW